MSREENIVIGSGPSGVAAATALLAQGRRVTMLDVGVRLEEERETLRSRLSRLPPDRWSQSDLEFWRKPSWDHLGIGIQPFGSGFVFQDPVGFSDRCPKSNLISLKPSFAKGGMSNGWGAAILPFRDEDIQDWPVTIEDLRPHYRAVIGIVPNCARDDELADVFPGISVKGRSDLMLTGQAAELLGRLEAHQDRLGEMGVHVGGARQAISPNCCCCASCLYGCPYGYIFNAGDVIEQLQAIPRFRYVPGVHVENFDQRNGTVEVRARNLENGSIIEYSGNRLFVACGALSTTRLVLRSLGLFDSTVILKDSQQFFQPNLHIWRPQTNMETEPYHTLAQLFVELIDPAISRATVHVQIYTYNDLYCVDMRHRYPALARIFPQISRALSRRLIVAQGFLHSEDSAAIELRLSRESQRLSHKVVDNPATKPVVRSALDKLRRTLRIGGLIPLPGLNRLGEIGSSFHCGGTFPMRQTPGELETDCCGRLHGLDRVHIVDSSVLPSIPATTITLSVMANAHRIATLACNAN